MSPEFISLYFLAVDAMLPVPTCFCCHVFTAMMDQPLKPWALAGPSFLMCLLLGIYVNEKSNIEVPPYYRELCLCPQLPLSTSKRMDSLRLPGTSLGQSASRLLFGDSSFCRLYPSFRAQSSLRPWRLIIKPASFMEPVLHASTPLSVGELPGGQDHLILLWVA